MDVAMAESAMEPIGKDQIERDPPEAPEERAALVARWQADVLDAAKHWKKDFDRMRRNMKFAAGKQWPGQKEDDPRYMANMVQRIVKTMVSSLYAKNPTPVVQRRQRLDFKIWDGDPESAARAAQTMAEAQMAAAMTAEIQMGGDPAAALSIPPIDPAAVLAARELLADIQQGLERHQTMDKIGKTLACLLEYFLAEGVPSFKSQMKRVVKRARVCGVGYVRLGFQRAMQLSSTQERRIADMAERMAVIGRLQADIADGKTDPHAAEAEELRLAIEAVRSQPEMIVREGLVFSFPHSTRIIPSISTESLVEWAGSEWIAEEIMLSPNKVKEIYGKDVGSTYKAYAIEKGAPESSANRPAAEGRGGLVRVWHIYDRASGLELVIAEGYPDFLKEPTAPEVFIEQFYPVFAITFNDVDAEGCLFPDSDVQNVTHIQREYNRSREALRQHRLANRPLYLCPTGAMEEEEEKSLENYPAHAVIKLNGLADNQKASDVLQPVQKIGIDMNVYETGSLLDEISRVTGNQEAVLGGISRGTATESNIAESSRQGTLGLDSDDLDDMLSLLFRACGQIMLTELSADTVRGIVGPGAVWPELTRREIMEEMWLEVKAGSSGRPDQAREASNFERIYPLLVQTPGIKPKWLAERAIRIADDSTDLTDAFEESLPSILAMNRQAQASTGDPATDPAQQGAEGADKNRAGRPGGGDQNSFPA